MAKVKFIDSEYKRLLEKVNPAIRKEVGYSFDIARRINDLLIKRHWSQADLARKLGKPKSLVSRWLSGTHNFTIQTIAEIETALGYPIISVRKAHPSNHARGYKPQLEKARLLNDVSTSDFS